MAPAVDQPTMSAHEAAAINAAAVTRNYSVKPRLQYQTVSAVSGKPPTLSQAIDTCMLTLHPHDRPTNHPRQCKGKLFALLQRPHV
jgi:hypothetical protein